MVTNFCKAPAARSGLRLMRHIPWLPNTLLPSPISSAAGYGRIMIEFELPWPFLLLPLPLLVWWLMPAYRDQQTSVHVPFFDRLAEATGQTPQPGAVILRRRDIQMIIGILALVLIVVALAS